MKPFKLKLQVFVDEHQRLYCAAQISITHCNDLIDIGFCTLIHTTLPPAGPGLNIGV
jgi:hypothetical protein